MRNSISVACPAEFFRSKVFGWRSREYFPIARSIFVSVLGGCGWFGLVRGVSGVGGLGNGGGGAKYDS